MDWILLPLFFVIHKWIGFFCLGSLFKLNLQMDLILLPGSLHSTS